MVMAAQVDRTLERQVDRFGRTGPAALFGSVVERWEGRQPEAMEELSSRLRMNTSFVFVSCQSFNDFK